MYSLSDIKLFECHWHYSKTLVYVYAGCFLISLAVIWLLAISLAERLIMTLMLDCFSIWIFLQQVLLIMPNSFIAIRRDASGWLIGNKQNKWQIIKLIPSSCIVLAWIVILKFRIDGKKRTFTICLPFDGLSIDEHRKLRVFLRYLL